MALTEFILKREEEKKWLNMNGYENDNPITNGEYRIVEVLADHLDVFVDVGANNGEFSAKILEINPNIDLVLFEPNPSLKPVLESTFGEKASIYSVALSNLAGPSVINIHKQFSTASSLFERTEMMPKFNENMMKVPIETHILDDYFDRILTKVSKRGIYIKIDVEGAELNVIQGSRKMMGVDHPIFLHFEYSHGWKEANQYLKDAFHQLDHENFNIYRMTPLGLEHVRFFSIQMEDYRFCNYLAVKNFNIDPIFSEKVKLPTQSSYTDFFPFSKISSTGN